LLATAVRRRRVIEDGKTGCLVAPDAESLGRGLADLLADPAGRARLGRAAALAAREHYDLAATAGAYEALYRDLVRSRSGGGARGGAAGRG
jgi:glycosyltransferase involved in cell wall biosynthesis